MHKITKIEEEKLCEVMEIIEKAATLMEENDLETDKEVRKEILELQKRIRTLTGKKQFDINQIYGYWAYSDLETIATKLLMKEPQKLGLSDEALKNLIISIFDSDVLEKLASFDYWCDFLELETGIEGVMDYLFCEGENGNIVYAHIDMVMEQICRNRETQLVYMNENQKYIEKCFYNLIKNNIISENDLKPSTISDEDISHLQNKFNIKLPQLYREFLKSYFFEFNTLLAVVDNLNYFKEQYVMIIPNNDNELKGIYEYWSILEEEFNLLSNGFVPIGDWGDGFGPLCIDTNKCLEQVVYNDKKTWTMVWFDHEEFFGGEKYEDFTNVAIPAAPDFREFMEWYFLDKYKNIVT